MKDVTCFRVEPSKMKHITGTKVFLAEELLPSAREALGSQREKETESELQ